MPARIAHRNEKARVRKQLQKIGKAGDVVVVLGKIPLAAANEQDLADVIGVEPFECRMGRLAAEEVGTMGIVKVGEEVHPDHFFHRFGAVRRDADAVAMGPFARLDVASVDVREGAIPEDRREDEGKVAIAVGRHARRGSEKFEQDRRTGAGETGDIDRPVDAKRLEFVREHPTFELAEAAPEAGRAFDEASETVDPARNLEPTARGGNAFAHERVEISRSFPEPPPVPACVACAAAP